MSPNSQHGNIINTPIYNGSGITTNLVIRGDSSFFHFLSRINLNHPVYHDDLIFIIELVLRFMYTPILFLVSSIATSIFNYIIWHTLLPIPKPERTAIGTTLTQTEIGSVLHLSVESIDSLYYPNESF